MTSALVLCYQWEWRWDVFEVCSYTSKNASCVQCMLYSILKLFPSCVHKLFMCHVLMHGRCHAGSWLIEFSGVAPSCFTFLVWPFKKKKKKVKPEDMFNPLFKAILYSVSWVRKLVSDKIKKSHVRLCNNECLHVHLPLFTSIRWGCPRSAARTLMLAFSQVPCVSGLCQTMHGDNLHWTDMCEIDKNCGNLCWTDVGEIWFKLCMKQSTP